MIWNKIKVSSEVVVSGTRKPEAKIPDILILEPTPTLTFTLKKPEGRIPTF